MASRIDWKRAMLRANAELLDESPAGGPSRGVKVPPGFKANGAWGTAAQAFAERLHKAYGLKPSGRLTTRLKAQLESYLPTHKRYRFNPLAPRNKKWLAWWAKKQQPAISIPRRYNWRTPWVGAQARVLVRAAQEQLGHPVNGLFGARLLAEIRPARKRYKIEKTNIRPNGALTSRRGAPPQVVEHNAAARRCTWRQIDAWHKLRGFIMAGYTHFVTKGGRIFALRPTWAMGAHTLHHNDCLGICAEGNYDLERQMPPAQLAAIVWLTHKLKAETAKKRASGHKEMSGNATSCPGRHYPLAKVKAA